MADLTLWTRERASAFLGTSAAAFDAVAKRHALTADASGHFLASSVAGLAEKLAAEADKGIVGWRGDFLRDGFAHLPALIPRDQMELVDSWARERLAVGADQPEGAVAVYGPTGGLVRVNNLDQDQASVELITQLPFGEFARELIYDALMYRLSIVVRSVTTPPELGRHRDPRWSARHTRSPVFAFGLHLDSASGEAGDVYYSPGTHQLREDGTLPAVDDPDLPEHTLATQRGDAVLHNLGVVHGAHPYSADRERVSVYCSFASAREIAHSPWGPSAA